MQPAVEITRWRVDGALDDGAVAILAFPQILISLCLRLEFRLTPLAEEGCRCSSGQGDPTFYTSQLVLSGVIVTRKST